MEIVGDAMEEGREAIGDRAVEEGVTEVVEVVLVTGISMASVRGGANDLE